MMWNVCFLLLLCHRVTVNYKFKNSSICTIKLLKAISLKLSSLSRICMLAFDIELSNTCSLVLACPYWTLHVHGEKKWLYVHPNLLLLLHLKCVMSECDESVCVWCESVCMSLHLCVWVYMCVCVCGKGTNSAGTCVCRWLMVNILWNGSLGFSVCLCVCLSLVLSISFSLECSDRLLWSAETPCMLDRHVARMYTSHNRIDLNMQMQIDQ